MDIYSSCSLTERMKKQIEIFLSEIDIKFDGELDYTVVLLEDGKIIGTGSRKKNILKYIGVSRTQHGTGLAATIVTELINNAYSEGLRHLFLYTTPSNIDIFTNLGFYLISETDEVALLENKDNGINEYLTNILNDRAKGIIGCIVANCNPFTLGHYYLAEYASRQCDFVYFFVLSEDASYFPAEARLLLAKKGLKLISNIKVCSTGDYLISSTTFPDYFLKEKKTCNNAYYDLDLAVFVQHFAKHLNIVKRYVGTEPIDDVTKGYNVRMKEVLPRYGIDVEEIRRKNIKGKVISASTVRNLITEGNIDKISGLVPKDTYSYIERMIRGEK